MHVYNGRRDKLAQLLQAVPHVLSNGAHGVKDGKIVMEGLMQFPFEFGKPYDSGDCARYVGASGGELQGRRQLPLPLQGAPVRSPLHVVRHAPGPCARGDGVRPRGGADDDDGRPARW